MMETIGSILQLVTACLVIIGAVIGIGARLGKAALERAVAEMRQSVADVKASVDTALLTAAAWQSEATARIDNVEATQDDHGGKIHDMTKDLAATQGRVETIIELAAERQTASGSR